MSTHTPAISAAIAAPTFRGTAILVIVTHFSPVDPFEHNGTSVSAIVFEASIPEAPYRLPGRGSISSFGDYFSVSLRAYISPVVCFLIVFPADMVHKAVNI